MMMALKNVNGVEVKRTDLEYIFKINLMILAWMLRLRRRKEEEG